MAETAEPTTYPRIPAKSWAALRSRSASTPSTKFTPNSVAALLNLASPESASINVVRPLRQLGLVEDDGSLTARGRKWRVDATYAEACQEIIDGVYPDELAGLTDAGREPDKSKLRDWFNHAGFGGSNARSMAATYAMIAAKKLPDVTTQATATKSKPSGRSKPATSKTSAGTAAPATNGSQGGGASGTELHDPTLQLSIQIHIPADATAEQINHIFASMAKHLYRR